MSSASALLVDALVEEQSALANLANEVADLIRAENLRPAIAAERIVAALPDDVSSAEVLACVRLAVADMAGVIVRRAAGSSSRRSIRPSKVDTMIAVLESTMSTTAGVLVAMRVGADGRDKALSEFTAADHEYRIRIEESTEIGARTRRMFHEAAIAACNEASVATIGDLPMSVQFDLARMWPDGE